MSRTRSALLGMISSYFHFGFLILVQLILTPILLKRYGQETLGGYASLTQLIGYLTILEGALSITFNRFFAQALGRNDGSRSLNDVFKSALLVYFGVGILNSIVCLVAAIFSDKLFHASEVVGHDIKMAILLTSLFVLIKTPLGVYGMLLNASQKMALLNVFSIVSVLIRGFVTLFTVLLGFGITGIVFANFVAEIIVAILCFLYVRKTKMTGTAFTFGLPSANVFREIAVFSANSLVIQLTTKLRLSSDALLVGIFIGLTTSSIYYSSMTPPLMCFTLANMIIVNVLPGLNQIIGQGDFDKVRDVYFKLLRYVIGLALLCFFGIVSLNKYVVEIWVGSTQFIGSDINLMFAINVFLLIMGSFNGNFLISLGVINKVAKVALWLALFGVILSYILIREFGTFGLITSSIAVLIPGNVYSHIQIAKALKTDLLLRRL